MEQPTNKRTWAIDPVHTSIRFEARYLLITSVSGMFREFEGMVVSNDDDFTQCSINLTIYTHSLFTGNETRDNHLRSADFFDSKNHPVITFKSTDVNMEGTNIQVSGLLRVKGIEHPYSFNAAYTGTAVDPDGNTKAGFELETVFNRKDFDMSWNRSVGVNVLLLSDEIKLRAEVQLLRLS